MNEPHKRRVRYKGSHPRNFDEKYKELSPEQYKADIKKVMARGQTPAGMHRPICVKEIINVLDIQPGDVGLDCTLGFGGHTFYMLQKVADTGHLVSLDVDSIEFPKTVSRLREKGFSEKVFTPLLMNFAGISKLVEERGRGFDFILADPYAAKRHFMGDFRILHINRKSCSKLAIQIP